MDSQTNKERQKFQQMDKIAKDIVAGLQNQKVEFLGADVVTIKGKKGDKGEPGKDGKMLKGFDGKNGRDGVDGVSGKNGSDGAPGKDGIDGERGADSTVTGPKGEMGLPGIKGKDGKDGSPDKPEEIIKKIQTVKKQWLDIEAIKGDFNSKVSRPANNFYDKRIESLIDVDLSGLTKTDGKYVLGSGTGGDGTGDVVGPASATDGHLAVFDGATGKIIKDGGAVPVAGGSGTVLTVTVGAADADYLVGDYTDIGAAINAAYLALPATGGSIFIQSGSYTYTTPIVFGTDNKFVSLRGFNAASTFLKYSPTSGNAVTYNDGNPTGHLVHEIAGITFMGKATLIAAAQANTNTSIGIYYGGANGAVGINTHDCNFNGFGSNWEIGANAYMLNFQNNGNSGGNGGQVARGSLVHINAASNSGERNNFIGNNFTDPGNSDATNAIYITNAGTASNFFSNNSIDNAQMLIGASNGTTSIISNHFENPGTTTYPEYIPILGVSSDSSTQITLIGNEFANSASGRTWTTIIRHGGQLYAAGNHIDNYNSATVTNFILHDLDNGLATDYVVHTSVQGGALANIIGGSGGVAYSLASAATAMFNVSNSYSIGLRAIGSNTNEFFSGGTTTATYDHSGNWNFKTGVTTIKNTNTILDASTFAGADIGAQINAAYAAAVTASLIGVIITVPAGVFSFSTPIVFGSNGVRVSLRGTPGGGTYLTYTGSNSTTAITVNTGIQSGSIEHTSYDAIKDITLKGNDSASAHAKIGIYMGGAQGAAGACLTNVNIETFAQGLYLGANTYHFGWYNGVIRNCAQLIYVAAPDNSGEAIHFYNGFFVDPYDTTYVTANAIQLADSGSVSCYFDGCSFDDMQLRIGQANNVVCTACHFETPGAASWGTGVWIVIDDNTATNVALIGCTFWNGQTTYKPTGYITNGGSLSLTDCIARNVGGGGGTVTNFVTLTSTGRVTWSNFNLVSAPVTNIVNTLGTPLSGFANYAGSARTVDTNGTISTRVITTTDDATAVIDVTLTDVYQLSAVANATTFSTTGTPVDGQTILIRFKDAGTAKGLTWDAIFVAIGVTLPSTTVANKWHYVGVKYNTAATKFHVLAVGVEA